MSDVRALLKAKRQEARVTHPLASYSSTGQLRCIACGILIKQASSWDGHVGSKAHRVNVIKMREEQKQKEEQQALGTPKRKAEQELAEDHLTVSDAAKKRKIEHPTPPAPAPAPTNGLPNNFFSDPSRASVIPLTDDSDDEQEESAAPAPLPVVPTTPLDLEWEQFQRAMLDTVTPDVQSNSREAYERATVVVEPELNDIMEGLPEQQSVVGDIEGSTSTQRLDEEQSRKLKEREEKELIMDRFIEEERAQEEADARVTLLKSRLDALKKRRQMAKAAKVAKA